MKYWAYLSYAHADERHARWLHRRIESFRVPRPLRGNFVAGLEVGNRLRPLFRDRDELSSSGDLKASLEDALSASTALIVLCSPAAAESRWVNQEIETFVATHGARRVFPLIVEGEPNSGGQGECFPPALRGEGAAGLEPIAGDLRPHADGRRDGSLKVIAGLLDVGFDAIKRRDAQRRHRTAMGIAAGTSLIAVVATVMALYAVHQRDIAQLRRTQAEDLIGFMLGDLRTRLREVGRLDVLDAVGDKAEEYFAALPPSEINDHALEKQAMSMRQIGEVRLQQGRHEDAQRVFEASLLQLEELAARNPSDAEVLFERSQAEFWAGAAYYRALSLDRARVFFRRYADSAEALVELAPGNLDYRMEQGYALSNLGTLAVDQGDLDAAETAFAHSGAVFAELAGERSDDPELRFESAASESWRARVRQAQFDWPGAVELRRSAARQHAEASAASGHPFHRRIEAGAWTNLGTAELAVGRPESAWEAERRAGEIYTALDEQDPENLLWRLLWLRSQARQALLAEFTGRAALPDTDVEKHYAEALEIAATNPENRHWTEDSAAAGLDLAMLHLVRGNPSQASTVLAQASLSVLVVYESAPDDLTTARLYLTQAVLAALIEGDLAAAREARGRLSEAPAVARAHRDLSVLLDAVSGNPVDSAVDEVRESGFVSPVFEALLARARE